MKYRLKGRLGVMTLLVAGAFWSLEVAAQAPDAASRTTDGGAGPYSGRSSGLDGLLLYVRALRPTAPWFSAGPRLEFRDDSGSRGRAQVVSGGLEIVVSPFADGASVTPYLPVQLALDAQHVGGGSDSDGLRTGVFPRVGAGLGLRLGVLWIEQRWSLSPGGDFDATVVGFTSSRPGEGPYGSSVVLMGHELFPRGTAYAREPDYRGYSVALERQGVAGADAWRTSLGIDFVDFTYSTGVLHLLTGPVLHVLETGRFGAQVTAQAGWTFFAEGGNATLPLGASAGLEGTLDLGHGAELLFGAGVFATSGPEGLVYGPHPRLGLVAGF